MKLLRTAALAGVAKKVYDESRKPENQRRIKEAVASVKAEARQALPLTAHQAALPHVARYPGLRAGDAAFVLRVGDRPLA